jgi:hypothetical protein
MRRFVFTRRDHSRNRSHRDAHPYLALFKQEKFAGLISSQPTGAWDIEVQALRELRFGTRADLPVYYHCTVAAMPRGGEAKASAPRLQ